MNIVEVKDFSFSYPDQRKEALEHASMEIQEGTLNVICGRSGCGKSTLLRQLKSVLAPHGASTGSILFKGTPLNKVDHRTQSSEIGYVMQNPDNQIICTLVEEEVGFGPENIGVPTDEIWQRVADSLQAVGMYSFRKASPNKLSGGQKQRVFIAMALAQDTKVLFLDEPTTYLDIRYQLQILKLIRRLNKEFGMTIVMVFHDINQALYYSDEIAAMRDGQIAAKGKPDEIITSELINKVYGVNLDVEIHNNKPFVISWN